MVPAHPQWGGARLGECHDGFGAKVVGGKECPHGNGLVDEGKGLAFKVVVENGFFRFFRC